jgi:hypothetical protein
MGGCARQVATPAVGQAGDGPPAARTVWVSGEVAQSCVGPIVVGRPPACSAVAGFERQGRRVVVRGAFRVALAPGTYRISVDTCANQQTLTVTRAVAGLKLVPHCPLPMEAPVR